jgi:hypothetical protein
MAEGRVSTKLHSQHCNTDNLVTSGWVSYPVCYVGQGLVHIEGRVKWAIVGFSHASQCGMQFKTYLWNFPFKILGSLLTVGN